MNEELLMNTELGQLLTSLKGLTEMEEETLSDGVLEEIEKQLDSVFTDVTINESVNQIIQNLENQNLTKTEAKDACDALASILREVVYGDEATPLAGNKKKLIDMIMNMLTGIFDKALEKYHTYSIELPIMLEDGAQVPTYAHDSDAAADMYAMEDTTISAHSTGTPVKTGVHIQLPEGWVAFVLPRSSIGAKTPLRLSNSAGVIDSGYRGEVRALYDNIGDEPFQIHKGDRIAQMLVMPSYRFKANVVDSLEDSDRGSGGFGSTGV